MGEVKLYNGDCLEVMDSIPDKSVDLVLCDLPYGTSRCRKWDSVIPFDSLWKHIKRIRKDYIPIVLFGKEPFSSMLRMSNMDEFKYDWIWKKDTKSNFPQAPYQPLNNIEIISVFSNGYARYGDKKMPYYPQMEIGERYKLPKESGTTSIFAENHRNGTYRHKDRDTSLRYPYNTLEFNTDKSHLHPTQKPVALLEYLIKTYTNECENVIDMTMGSGSTGVACVNTGRNFIGIEKDLGYFRIAEQRIGEALEGKQETAIYQ